MVELFLTLGFLTGFLVFDRRLAEVGSLVDDIIDRNVVNHLTILLTPFKVVIQQLTNGNVVVLGVHDAPPLQTAPKQLPQFTDCKLVDFLL